jgi:hypothetical protein
MSQHWFEHLSPPFYICLRWLKKLAPFALFITKIYKTCLPSYPKNHIGMEKGKYGERGGGKGTRWGGKGKG